MYLQHISGSMHKLSIPRLKHLRKVILSGQGQAELTLLVGNGYQGFLAKSGEVHMFEDLLREFSEELPREVLAAFTVAKAAKVFHSWLRSQAMLLGSDPEQVALWSPAKSAEMGYGYFWSFPWEEGPHEWTMITAGSTLHAGSTGVYSTPGPFPNGLRSRRWYAEAQNHWMLYFNET